MRSQPSGWPLAAVGALAAASLVLAADAVVVTRPFRVVSPVRAQEQPVFRSATTLVAVDVIVTDRDGRFVRDLGPDDFELLDEGAPQTIAAFTLVDSVEPSRPAGTIVPQARATASSSSEASAAAPGRLFILFFDTAHLSPGSFKRLHDAATAFVASSFKPFDIGGVVAGGTMVGGRLATGADELADAVRKVKLPIGKSFRQMDLRDWPRFMSEAEIWRVDRGDDAALKQVVMRAVADDPGIRPDQVEPLVKEKAARLMNEMRQATRESLDAFGSLVAGLARFQGRKTVLFLSEGLFIEEHGSVLRRIIDEANRVGVTMYSVDARGLDRTAPGRDVRDPAAMADTDLHSLTAFDTWQDAPNSLAVDTGGLVLRNTNDFAGALRQAAEDTSRYYLLGYSPGAPGDGRRFRRIQVKVRRAGLVVRARKGYGVAESGTALGSGSVRLQPDRDIVSLHEAPLVRDYLQRLSVAQAEPVVTRAVNLALEGQWVEVEDAAVAAARESAIGHTVVGLARFALRDYERAAEALEHAVTLARGDALPSFFLGWVRATAGREREAIGAFRYAAVLDPKLLAAHLALADAYLRLGERPLALQAVKAGLAALPDSPELREKLVMLEKPRQP